MSYLTVSNNDVINTTNNETTFPEVRILFKEAFEIKSQEGSVLKYQHLRIFRSHLGFSVDHTDHIMKLVNEWSLIETFRKFDATFMIDSTYEKELMAALPL